MQTLLRTVAYVANSGNGSSRASAALDAQAFASAAPGFELQLRAHVAAAAREPLRHSPFNRLVLLQLFARVAAAPTEPDEERRFFLFAAPLVRRVLVQRTVVMTVGLAGQSANFDVWFKRLESFDPLSALMIDLHYFCGLSVRETASILDMPADAVVRDLRFARAWLLAYLGRLATEDD